MRIEKKVVGEPGVGPDQMGLRITAWNEVRSRPLYAAGPQSASSIAVQELSQEITCDGWVSKISSSNAKFI